MLNKAFIFFILFLLIPCSASAAQYRDPVYDMSIPEGKEFRRIETNGKKILFCSKYTYDSYLKDGGEKKGLSLRCGWYFWDPYQYMTGESVNRRLTGLDVGLIIAIFENAGISIGEYDEVPWQQHQLDIKEGRRDIAGGATYTDERAEYMYYSAPYRKETNVLYLPKGMSGRFPFDSIGEMLELFKEKRFRLGVVKGYAYADPEINAYVRQHNETTGILSAANEKENFENLFKGRIDGFLADRIVGATVAWRHGWQSKVEEHPTIVAETPIHVLFSKKTTSPALVEVFNRSLSQLREEGRYGKWVREYMMPVMLAQTIEKKWFLSIDIIGTIAFAISGLLLARKGNYDIFGAIVLAALPAVGGGIMRDILVQRSPIGVLRTPLYIYAIFITVFSGFILLRLNKYITGRSERRKNSIMNNLNFLVQIFDALGLAAFTIIGVVIAVEAKASPLFLWGPMLAVLTSCGGGILRDIVRSDPEISAMKGAFYPEIAVIWGGALSVFLYWQTSRLDQGEIFMAVIACLFGGFITRIIAIKKDIKAPTF